MYITNGLRVIDTLLYFQPANKVANLLKVTTVTLRRWLDKDPIPASHTNAFEDAQAWLQEHIRDTVISVEHITLEFSNKRPKSEAAVSWLEKFLGQRAKAYCVIKEKSQQAGFNYGQLRRAASTLGVHSKSTGFGINKMALWSLTPFPEDNKPRPKTQSMKRYR